MRETQRIHLDLLIKDMDRLRDLRDRTDAQSIAKVITSAARVYDTLLREVEAGNALLTRNMDGVIQPFWVFL